MAQSATTQLGIQFGPPQATSPPTLGPQILSLHHWWPPPPPTPWPEIKHQHRISHLPFGVCVGTFQWLWVVSTAVTPCTEKNQKNILKG